MDEIHPVNSELRDLHRLCPFKVMTGLRIDLFAIAPGCIELGAIMPVFVARLASMLINGCAW